MNHLTNARDSLNAKYPGTDDDKRLLVSASGIWKEHADWVRPTVEDQGPGIPQELQKPIYGPSYTTKPPGKGAELGLWLVYSIVENHHRRILVESEPGAHTRFHVEFPACDVHAGAATLH